MARKILLADDSVTAQNMGRKILADAGYEVVTVNNGSAALKKIAESRPDLIVLDVYMPGYSGLEVCQRLKETGETARIPILLTVGKLEPFKPEEAKRVRAEGFIVKPFEASELLSALTKLEDKIVPRSDSSKPGRFARAIAAVEEGRRDNTVSIDEDSGWKNRIAFPSKKKEKKPDPEDGDDPAIYNAVNKDLRTTVEHNPSTVSSEAKPAEAPVNVAALAPEGLPKDVTPEEIAALAAAAAQVAGVANGKSTEPVTQSPQAEANIAVVEQEPAPPATPEIKSEVEPTSVAQAKAEESQPVAEAKAGEPQPVPEATPADKHADGATFAASKSEEESAPQVVEAATSPIEQAPEAQPAPEPEPVTIAASSEARAERPSRWAAVAVAVAPEEANISIEDEMRLAYTAFVGAQASATANPEVPVLPAEVQHEPAPTSFASTPAAEVAMPEVRPTLSVAAEAAHASMTAAVKEFEAVATRKIEPPVADSPVADSTHSPEPASSSPVEAPVSAETRKEELAPHIAPETTAAPVPAVESKAEPVAQPESSQPSPERAPVAPEFISAAKVEPQPAVEVLTQAEPTAAPRISESTQSAAPEPVAQETHESAASAAAAGASWRRIRESAAEPSSDEAAMAVAAGAEKAPQDVATDSNEAPEIASIVDSVLADLRPKIVAEISKKLGKKK